MMKKAIELTNQLHAAHDEYVIMCSMMYDEVFAEPTITVNMTNHLLQITIILDNNNRNDVTVNSRVTTHTDYAWVSNQVVAYDELVNTVNAIIEKYNK